MAGMCRSRKGAPPPIAAHEPRPSIVIIAVSTVYNDGTCRNGCDQELGCARLGVGVARS